MIGATSGLRMAAFYELTSLGRCKDCSLELLLGGGHLWWRNDRGMVGAVNALQSMAAAGSCVYFQAGFFE